MIRTQTPPPAFPALRLALLGMPEIWLDGQRVTFRTRKAVALLAYLALEPGLHQRSKLAAMLWPDADEASGRASLRSTLNYLNQGLGRRANLTVASREALGFKSSDDLALDVRLLEAAVKHLDQQDQMELAQVSELYRGDFLEGFELADAPQFDDWVTVQRELARQRLEVVFEQLSNVQTQAGEINAALETARRWVRLEPLNEAAHRLVIELCLRAGKRAAALEAFRACHAILNAELGLEPDAQTRALIERLRESGTTLPIPVTALPTASPSAFAPPGSVRLIGRGHEWAQMEAAWNAGQTILISGEPGSGKTRLMLEFAATKGVFAHSRGRPGDQNVPFSSVARAMRDAVHARPDLELPDWVRRELSRLVPELMDEPTVSPLSLNEDRLRLFQAVECVYEVLGSQGIFPVADDTQLFDDSSMELVTYLMADSSGHLQPHSLHAFRRGEASERFMEIVRQLVEAGHAVLIELAPLRIQDVGEMLTDLMPEGFEVDELGTALHQFTGGNPLFVLETVRALAERGELEALTARRFENRRRVAGLPRTPKVQSIIHHRLERLSGPARNLARVAAVMGEEFTLELGAKVLETTLTELSRAGGELERTQVWCGLRFSHDLLFETVLTEIPESLRLVLHGQVLDALEGAGAPAAVLAQHARAAGRVGQTIRYGVQAGLDAFALRALTEAVEHLERVRAALYAPPGVFNPQSEVSDVERWQVYSTLFECYEPNGLHRPAAREEVLTELLAFEAEARNPHVKQNIRRLRVDVQTEKTGDDAALMSVLRAQLEEARRNQNRQGEFNRLMDIGFLEFPDVAKATFAAALALAQELGDERGIGSSLTETARMDMLIGDWNGAEAGFERASRHISPHDQHSITRVRWLRARNWLWLGRSHEATAALRSCLHSWQLLEDHARGALTRSWLSLALLETGECGEALEMAQQADNLALTMPFARDLLLMFTVSVRLQLGQLDTARVLMEGAAADWGDVNLTHTWIYRLEVMSCALCALRGDWVLACQHAVNAVESRPHRDRERHLLFSLFGSWFETEALLRGGQAALAREGLQRFAEVVEPYPRLRISHLRSLAVLEAREGHLGSATRYLKEAKNLALELNLPTEIWQIEVKLAELLAANGDLEGAQTAQNSVLAVVKALADSIHDDVSRAVFLKFTARHKGTRSSQ